MSLARHFVTLLSGRLLSQLILVGSTPILTRLYAPEDFGLISLVNSITQIPLIYLMGRLEQAVPQCRDDGEAGRVAGLALTFSLMITTLSAMLVYFNRDWIIERYHSPHLPEILLASIALFIPISISKLGQQWSAYRERHGVTASADVLFTLSRRVLPIPLYSAWGASPWGLFTGQALGAVMSGGIYLNRMGRDVISLLSFRPSNLWLTLKEYRDFPLFLGMTSVLDVTVWGLFFAMIGDAFGLSAVGWLGQAYALLFLPISLLNQSSTNIFYPRLARAREDQEALSSLVKRMQNLSFDLGLFPLLALIPISPQLWGWMLGDAFYMSGVLAQALIPLALITLIFSPVSVAINVFNRQRDFFSQALILNTLRLGAVYLGCWHEGLKSSFESEEHLCLVISAYSAVTVIFRLGQLFWILKMMKVKARGLISGLFVKLSYTAVALLAIYVARESFRLDLIPLMLITVLFGSGWLGLVLSYNLDAQSLMKRWRSRLGSAQSGD